MIIAKCIVFSAALFLTSAVNAAPLRTNCCNVQDPPAWATRDIIQQTARRIEEKLNWQIRRIDVLFYPSEEKLMANSSLSFTTLAFTRREDQSVHISPKVTKDDFDRIFGHELVHVIFRQKYKSAIPAWLEEGLANNVGSTITVDYPWLKKQNLGDVTDLVHPSTEPRGHRYHYQASTAVTEMIAAKCKLNDLLMLSVGRKLESYLDTFCKIPDVNAAFKVWVSQHP